MPFAYELALEVSPPGTHIEVLAICLALVMLVTGSAKLSVILT